MKAWISLFIGFFWANVLGYGGGPSSIPLMYEEIVNHYRWLTNKEFSNMLALGNALPGPIATKIAAYVGYDVYGWWGFVIALFATIFPSAFALIFLLKIVRRHRQSLVVKGMTLFVQPVIAIMMLILTWQMMKESIFSIGIVQSFAIAFISFLALEKWNIHPAFLIIASFAYGGLILPHL
ncbi:chromate transporter [Anoxybacillus tepidamans]|uniref:Chromate transporter n=1 Tax=Anoxybacteroides tepidamans TaxID=265948 RepID=A0A7W8ITE3_9BACL|nr:chromate transporter [Anoxybacillus tepidamans]MBB5325389.1 chromate transporter [Anoxybacillus tepidamans]